MMLRAYPEKKEPRGSQNHIVYCFDLTKEIENNRKTFTVQQLIDKILIGDTDDLIFTLKDWWNSQNIWTMNLRHRDVLTKQI